MAAKKRARKASKKRARKSPAKRRHSRTLPKTRTYHSKHATYTLTRHPKKHAAKKGRKRAAKGRKRSRK